MCVRREEAHGYNVSDRRHRRLGVRHGIPRPGFVRELAREDQCAVIYLTEQLARDMGDVLARYKDELRPAIILIPGREGSLGIGRDSIQRAIERAVGADIL